MAKQEYIEKNCQWLPDYGKKNQPGITDGSTLIFNIELINAN